MLLLSPSVCFCFCEDEKTVMHHSYWDYLSCADNDIVPIYISEPCFWFWVPKNIWNCYCASHAMFFFSSCGEPDDVDPLDPTLMRTEVCSFCTLTIIYTSYADDSPFYCSWKFVKFCAFFICLYQGTWNIQTLCLKVYIRNRLFVKNIYYQIWNHPLTY